MARADDQFARNRQVLANAGAPMSSDQDRLSRPPASPARPARPVRPPVRPAWVVNVALRREQERRLARLNDPRWEWARGLVVRRVAVVVWLALVAATVAMWSWSVQFDSRRRAVDLVLLVVASVLVVPLVRAAIVLRTQAIRGLLDLPIEQLTERQRRLRERISKLARRWLLALLVVGLVTVVASRGRLDGAGVVPMALVLASIGLPITVPTLVAAWIVPEDRAVHAARIPNNL
jgi:hypothetical protein